MKKVLSRLLLSSIALLISCSTFSAEESMAEKAGSKARELLGGFKDGFKREGEKRGLINIILTERAKKAQLVVNSAKEAGIEEVFFGEGISCYVVSPKYFKGRIVARALDKDGIELGQSRQLLTVEANAGKNVVFDFPRSLNTKLVEKYELDLFESAIQVDVQPEISEKVGLNLTQIEEPSDIHPRTLTSYAISKKTVNGRLVVKAFDPKGQEIDRSQTMLRMKPRESRHLTIPFTRNQGANRYSIEYEDGSGLVIEVGNSLKTLDLEVTRSKEIETSEKSLQVISYVIANKKFKGRVIARALDEKGVEIGRGTSSVDMKADDAKDIQFNFPASLETELVKKIVIDARKDEEVPPQVKQ